MIRRLGLVPAALTITSLFAVAGLSSCDKFEETASGNETAATVNGHELTLDQLDELVEGNDDPAVRRAALSTWIQVVAALEDPGELLTEAELTAARDLVLPPLFEAAEDEAQALYEQGVQGSPVLCLAVIPLAADVASEDVLDALEAGTPFAELAAEFSEDPSLVATGGVITFQGEECLPTEQWNAPVLEQLTSEEIVVGEPGVISINDAEVIVLLRPFADLTDESKTGIAQGPVSEALLALYRNAEVTVHESIGEWDGEQGIVVASSADE